MVYPTDVGLQETLQETQPPHEEESNIGCIDIANIVLSTPR